MTKAQQERLVLLLKTARLRYEGFVEGNCVGADDQAAQIAHGEGYELIVYPSNIASKQAHNGIKPLEEFPPMPPLKRNSLIVNRGKALIAAPKEFEEILRSGTWATVRYARRIGRPILILWPDGTLGH